MTQSTDTTPVTETDNETVNTKKTLGIFAVVLLLVGAYALFKEVSTVWQLVKQSTLLVVWYWIACSGLFGAFTAWSKRRIGLRVRDYGAIAIAPFAVFIYAYKGAKVVGSARNQVVNRISGHRDA